MHVDVCCVILILQQLCKTESGPICTPVYGFVYSVGIREKNMARIGICLSIA